MADTKYIYQAIRFWTFKLAIIICTYWPLQ